MTCEQILNTTNSDVSVKTKPVMYDEHYLYIRGFCEPIARQKLPTNTKPKIMMTRKIIKIGIAQFLSRRGQSYGSDDGWFYYAIPFECESHAAHIEGILRKIFKPYAVENSKEYFDAQFVATYLQVPLLEKDSYEQTMRALHAFTLYQAHKSYPKMVHNPSPYGFMFNLVVDGMDGYIKAERIYLKKEDIPSCEDQIQQSHDMNLTADVKSSTVDQSELELERERTKQLELKKEILILTALAKKSIPKPEILQYVSQIPSQQESSDTSEHDVNVYFRLHLKPCPGKIVHIHAIAKGYEEYLSGHDIDQKITTNFISKKLENAGYRFRGYVRIADCCKHSLRCIGDYDLQV